MYTDSTLKIIDKPTTNNKNTYNNNYRTRHGI